MYKHYTSKNAEHWNTALIEHKQLSKQS